MATNQLSEQEIQFRKRARRRLVGAIALVLLMVTVLPMILDDREVKPVQQDIAITIPSQDGGNFTSRIVPAAPETQQPAANVQLASPLEKPKPIDTPASQTDATKPVTTADKSPEPVAQAKPPASQSDEKPVKPAEPAKAKPPAAAAAKPVPKKGAFSVQVGVFTEGPKFQELESKLAAQGLHPSTEKLDTPKGPKLRLRVGSYASRTEAEAALDKLKSAGIAGMIVANK